MGIMILVVAIVVAIFIWMIYAFPGKSKMSEQNKPKDDKTLLEQLNSSILLLEVVRQAKMVGDDETVEAVMKNTYHGVIPVDIGGHYTSIYPDKLMILGIDGINYRGNLKSYVGNFKGVLVPEPNNEYDPNAIKVVCEDGKHLGYIAEKMTQEVRDFIGVEGSDWRHRITGMIDECQDDDEDDRKFFAGTIYIVKS